jgi:hypothetical protein
LEAPSIYRIRTIYIGNNTHHIPKYTISSLLDSGWSFKEHAGRAVIEFAALHLACSDKFQDALRESSETESFLGGLSCDWLVSIESPDNQGQRAHFGRQIF